MKTYTLTTGKKIVIQDSLTLVMKELMKIAKETGNIPEVKYSEKMRATEFRFEGYYCDFSLYLM